MNCRTWYRSNPRKPINRACTAFELTKLACTTKIEKKTNDTGIHKAIAIAAATTGITRRAQILPIIAVRVVGLGAVANEKREADA
jgi:hypothetical protein